MNPDSCTPPPAQYVAAALRVATTTKWHGKQWALTNRCLPMDRNWKQTRFSEGVFRVLLLFAFIGSVIAAVERASAQSNDATLNIEAKIPLGKVRGRIDHMAADIDRRRLFVAELGNNTVGVVDIGQSKVLQVLDGPKEPQGVGYLPSTLRLFQGPSYTENGRIDFGNDADNVRVDQSRQHVVVGYGDGALAVIDGAKTNKIGEVRLPAHPEGFQLDTGTNRAYVNLPNARGIAVADLSSGESHCRLASWRRLREFSDGRR